METNMTEVNTKDAVETKLELGLEVEFDVEETEEDDVSEITGMPPEKPKPTHEVVKDIFAVASILIKMGREDILEDQLLFIEFLNELGVRTTWGRKFTKMGFRQMMSRLNPESKKRFVQEFNEGFRDLYTTQTMRPHSDGSTPIESYLKSCLLDCK